MGYPDIKDSEHGSATALLLGIAFYPQAVVAPFAVIWAIFYFGFDIKELWLSFALTAMVVAALGCFVSYFWAGSIERAVARRKLVRGESDLLCAFTQARVA